MPKTIPGEDGFWNKGISACAVFDGAAPIFRNKPMAIIGGADSTKEEANFFILINSVWFIDIAVIQVGLPNVGKTTLFNTLTKLSISAENFPFCTIEPNDARVNIPDERFEWLCQLFKPNSEVPTFLEIHDIAGLVRGAHEGQGLGNSFLTHISVDGIFHVLRAFEDPNIIHVDDIVDPVRDLEIISAELRLKVNMDVKDYQRKKNKFLPKIHAWVQEHGAEPIIPFSCAFEKNLADMPPDEAAKYCEENKIQR